MALVGAISCGSAAFQLLQCDNANCNQKANGSKSGARISVLMALVSSFDTIPKESVKEHPRSFVREIHKG